MTIKAICDGCKKEFEIGAGIDMGYQVAVTDSGGHTLTYHLCKTCYWNARDGIRDLAKAQKKAEDIVSDAEKVALRVPLKKLAELLEGKDVTKITQDVISAMECNGYTLLYPNIATRRDATWKVRAMGYDAPPLRFGWLPQDLSNFTVCKDLLFYPVGGGDRWVPSIGDKMLWTGEEKMTADVRMINQYKETLCAKLVDTEGLRKKRKE